MARVLVCGGAGYIGSHMMKALIDEGHEALALDNLSSGFEDAVLHGNLVKADLANVNELKRVFSDFPCDLVMHFASSIDVADSVKNPYLYWNNNVVNTFNLIGVMRDFEVDKLVFSSTAAVYGSGCRGALDESQCRSPINPYGHTKACVEVALDHFRCAEGLASFVLRYFNAAGADADGRLGERHDPETHLIPLAIRAALDDDFVLRVNGASFATPDGTCIRDYVHVTDICMAHLLVVERLLDGDMGKSYNLGNGQGYSVFEVLQSVERVVGSPVKWVLAGSREGDPDVLVADASLIKHELGWTPSISDIDAIVESAVKFYRNNLQQWHQRKL